MLTTFDQVREWIQDNGFKRWILYKDSSKTEKIIDSQAFPVSDQDDKLAMTEKYLRLSGGRAYATGGANATFSELTVATQISLADAQPQGAAGVGTTYPSIGELTDTISKQIRAEIKAEQYEKEKADFEKAKKEFEDEKQSAIGALIHYFAPIGKQMLANKLMRNVAGVDADAPVDVTVQPIRVHHDAPADAPEDVPEQDATEEEPFTDEESEELMQLMVRFKKIEPRYLDLIRSVVQMAESGDATYTMAKGFLLQ